MATQRGGRQPKNQGALGLAQPEGGDPLTAEQAMALLVPADVVRDPLHGDIWLTALERCVVDSPEFQRLRGINQLGMTFVAYPGAVHNRFLHSLGTLHVCGRMIATCNGNAQSYQRLTPTGHPMPLEIGAYPALLARLCALMHDLAHVPFGHTLVKEGRAFQFDEWQDEERGEIIFGEAGLRGRLRQFFSDRALDSASADLLLDEIHAVLKAKREQIDDLRYPFVHDLVGNTICADLIDYVERDMYFCGLSERCGDRFLQYVAVIPVRRAQADGDLKDAIYMPDGNARDRMAFPLEERGGHMRFCKVVLLRYRYNERKKFVDKHDVTSEAIDLVRRRLDVAEKIYFHRTKLAASAMLVSAVYDARITATEIWNDTDADVLARLAKSENPRVSALGKKLQQRKIFKPLYRVSYRASDESNLGDALWGQGGVYHRFENPEACQQLVQRLERAIALHVRSPQGSVGTICVSCPDRRMNLKAFDMLVLRGPDKEVGRLQDSTHGPTQLEIRAIQEMHRHLWRFQVLADPDLIQTNPDVAMRLAGALQAEIGLANEVEEFASAPVTPLSELEKEWFVDKVLVEKQLHNVVKMGDYRMLLESVSRDGYQQSSEDWSKEREKLEQMLADYGYDT